MLIHSGRELGKTVKDFISNSSSIRIFVPFIKLETLAEITDGTSRIVEVVTRWNVDDIVRGSSDLGVYEYLRSQRVPLFINPRLHLKAYIDNCRCLITSANISSRALNMPMMKSFNYELGCIINDITSQDLIIFERIKSESIMVDDAVFSKIKEKVEQNKNTKNDTDAIIIDPLSIRSKDFSISSLPMTTDVFLLFEYYEMNLENLSSQEFDCSVHDLALYDVDLSFTRHEFYDRLRQNFFDHPFISAFLSEVDNKNGEIYFGRAKEWIQNNCTNVPLPRRWEITENIQILYNWIVNLGEGRYAVDVPGRHSQRLYRIK